MMSNMICNFFVNPCFGSRKIKESVPLIPLLYLFFLQIMILYFIPYYSRYIHGEHVAVGGRAGAY